MSEHGKKKWGIYVDEQWDGDWSFGICFNHRYWGETYLYINFFKWSISIGYMEEEMRGTDNE